MPLSTPPNHRYAVGAVWMVPFIAFIVHAVAPRWFGGGNGECELLATCYRSCLVAARSVRAASIAFPCLGTGAYLFPKPLAADIAGIYAAAFLSVAIHLATKA